MALKLCTPIAINLKLIENLSNNLIEKLESLGELDRSEDYLFAKLLVSIGKLAEAVIRHDKDDVKLNLGNCFVAELALSATMIPKADKFKPSEVFAVSKKQVLIILSATVSQLYVKYTPVQSDTFVSYLAFLASKYKLTLEECIQAAHVDLLGEKL